MRKRVLTAFLSAAALMVAAAPASAADAYSCEYSGLSTNSPAQSFLNDVQDGNPLDQESYNWTFSGTATCEHTDGDSGEAGRTGVYTAQMTMGGTGTSTLACGSGTRDGTGTLSTTAPGFEGDVTFNVHLEDHGGTTWMVITNFRNAQHGGGSGAGTESQTPAGAGNCITFPSGERRHDGQFTATTG